MDIGNVLKDLRIKKKLTQQKAAKKLRITQGSISRIEKNTYPPSKEVLKKMCSLYGSAPALVIWMAADEKDVPKNKLEAYRKLKPAVDGLISEFFK